MGKLIASTRQAEPQAETTSHLIHRLRGIALQALARMYQPDQQLFVFCLRRPLGGQNGPASIITEGISLRYTAMTLIGLAGEAEHEVSTILAGETLHDVCARLMRDVDRLDNMGDVALTLWAAHAVGYPDRRPAWKRLLALQPLERPHPTYELAWTLSALCISTEIEELPAETLRKRLAQRLLAACGTHSVVFPHVVGESSVGLRSHVASFADQIYPLQALALYAQRSGDRQALDVAVQSAQLICRHQGLAGQWWWHYDRRTGAIIEPYPVYAVHQDAMAPMVLFTLGDIAKIDFAPEIEKGLAWLAHAPELNGASLIDQGHKLIWRKVARHEPRKLVRSLQTLTSRVHPRLRVPGIDMVFPVGAVDYESRPYHMGWLLYAWPPARAAQWEERACQ